MEIAEENLATRQGVLQRLEELKLPLNYNRARADPVHMLEEGAGDFRELRCLLTLNHGHGDQLGLPSVAHTEPQNYWPVKPVLSQSLIDKDDV